MRRHGRTHRRVGSLSERRRRVFFARLRIILLFFAIVVTVLIWLVTRPQFEISHIAVDGLTPGEVTLVQSTAHKELEGFYLGVIPKALAFAVRDDLIKKDLLESFKSFETVKVKRSGLQTLVITVAKREPDALWCRRIENKKNNCYYMDKDGLIFGQAEAGDLTGKYIFYGALTPAIDPIGSVYLTPTRLHEIQLFLGTLQGVNLKAVSFERTDEGQYRVELERHTTLILDETSDLNHALSNISSLLSDPELKADFEKDPLPFEYVDLRLEKKVFFKRR